MRHHDYPMYDGGGGTHVLAWVLLVILFVLVVGVVVALVMRLADGRRGRVAPSLPPAAAKPGEDALEVLRLRYARGEIDRDAFLQAHADLGGGAAPGASPPSG